MIKGLDFSKVCLFVPFFLVLMFSGIFFRHALCISILLSIYTLFVVLIILNILLWNSFLQFFVPWSFFSFFLHSLFFMILIIIISHFSSIFSHWYHKFLPIPRSSSFSCLVNNFHSRVWFGSSVNYDRLNSPFNCLLRKRVFQQINKTNKINKCTSYSCDLNSKLSLATNLWPKIENRHLSANTCRLLTKHSIDACDDLLLKYFRLICSLN